jgi:phage/conjugal plasmid C-4 type zinc finger TraR family protein
MTCILDRATEREEQLRADALAEHQRRARASGYGLDPGGVSATDCEGPRCGEPIPEARRLALPGVRLCVTCQQRLEKGLFR